MYPLRERTDTFNWNKKTVASSRMIRPEDAGIKHACWYCGFEMEEERMVFDEGNWVCPNHLFDPQPEPPSI
ncbi:MAG: hypothetical protein C4542_04400 [Dehalococcoidia bacterium]|nr:MAG: hypothetical protein C4542_04400 [Dehalococcoidia bacterium]